MRRFVISILVSIILLMFSDAAQADVIVKYDFGPAYYQATLAPSVTAEHISGGNFSYLGNGSAAQYGTGSDGSGNCWYVSGGWNDSTYTDYFYFTVTIESGWHLDVSSILFDSKVSSMYGPEYAQVSCVEPETIIETDMDIWWSGWNLANNANNSSPAGLTGNVTFRIYAKEAGTGGGSFYIDNVIVNGTVVADPPATSSENIDPENTDNQYAYGENIGWINFEPSMTETGAIVSREKVEGFVWAENIGWINLSPENYGGVLNDGMGNLSGYAWGENVGWINFNPQVEGDPTAYGVKIDANGNFSGLAWGENIGWINFNND